MNYFCSFWRPRSNMFAFQYPDTLSAGSRRDTSGHRRACSGGARNGLSLLKIGMLYHTQSQEWGWNSQECVSMYFLPRIWDWSCLEITKQTFEIVWIEHDWSWLSMIEHDSACSTNQEYQPPVVGVLSHWLTWTMVIMVKIETMRGQIWSSLRW